MNTTRIATLVCLTFVSLASSQADAAKNAGGMSVTSRGDDLVIESRGGTVSYKAVLDRKNAGEIKQLCFAGRRRGSGRRHG